MRIQTTTTALACLLALSNLQVLGSDPIDRAWQTAIDPVTLHLRNKLADLPYTVTFIVTAIGQDTEWSYTTESEPNAWQRSQFPRDFTGPSVDHLQAKAYTWSARIHGDVDKRVMCGSFIYPNGGLTTQPDGSPAVPESGMLLAEFDQLFAKRQRYHLTSISGASTTDAPPGHYYQVDRRYPYTPAADGSWQQQVVTIHEVLHPID